jgi:acylphosphatase
MTGEQPARVRLIVSGLVQGVFFRRATADQASGLAITGWVRNLSNGSVEIMAEGKCRDLEALVAWAHRGPAQAKVEELQVQWQPYRGEFAQFRVR